MSKATAQPDAQIGPRTGRLTTGQFAPGNRLLVGQRGGNGSNPVDRRKKALQVAVVRSVTAEQVQCSIQ